MKLLAGTFPGVVLAHPCARLPLSGRWQEEARICQQLR